MQLFVLHNSISKLARISCTQQIIENQKNKIPKWFDDWKKLIKNRVEHKTIQQITGKSRATYYRLKKNLQLYGIDAVHKRSTKPKKLRQSQIPKETHQLVLQLRQQNPTYGKAKIAIILNRDHSITISESSVGRILKALISSGKIQKSISANRPTRKRQFKSHAQKWQYGMKAQAFGQLVQIDHMTVKVNGVTVKHFQAWDPVTKFILADVTSNATSAAAAKFLNKIVKDMPFAIQSIQVDGGSEFMQNFEQECQKLKIPLFVLPPRRPQWNGGVERGNRIFREEFYANPTLLADSIGDLRYHLSKALHKYNHYRPHFSLKGDTPHAYTQKLLSGGP